MSRLTWILVVSLAVLSPAGATVPARDESPWPEETALLADVLENQNRVEQARGAYTYTMTVTDLKRGSRGDVMRGTARTYEVFHVAGKQFRKLTAKDGQPLKPDEALKEEGRVAKAVREHRGIARTGGRAWVDEQARRLLRLEVQVKRALKVGGGLLMSVGPGSSLVFEQALVNEEVWLPTYAEIEVSARLLLLKGVKQHQEIRFSDYRKFSVETSEDVRAPQR